MSKKLILFVRLFIFVKCQNDALNFVVKINIEKLTQPFLLMVRTRGPMARRSLGYPIPRPTHSQVAQTAPATQKPTPKPQAKIPEKEQTSK